MSSASVVPQFSNALTDALSLALGAAPTLFVHSVVTNALFDCKESAWIAASASSPNDTPSSKRPITSPTNAGFLIEFGPTYRTQSDNSLTTYLLPVNVEPNRLIFEYEPFNIGHCGKPFQAFPFSELGVAVVSHTISPTRR